MNYAQAILANQRAILVNRVLIGVTGSSCATSMYYIHRSRTKLSEEVHLLEERVSDHRTSHWDLSYKVHAAERNISGLRQGLRGVVPYSESELRDKVRVSLSDK